MPSIPTQPKPSRPHIPEYGIPESMEGLLPWSYVIQQLEKSRNYWIASTRPDGRPHVIPVWGVFVDGTLYFGGGPQTRWSRNLAQNPAVVVHLESGNEVVILEGTAERYTSETIDPDLMTRIDDAYEAKYEMRHGTPVWALRPQLAFAWTSFPADTTRWIFSRE